MHWAYMEWFGLTEKETGDLVVATLIFLYLSRDRVLKKANLQINEKVTRLVEI